MAAINEAHLRKTAESLLGEDATLKEALADGTLTNRMLREHLAKATGINAARRSAQEIETSRVDWESLLHTRAHLISRGNKRRFCSNRTRPC